MTTTEEQPKTRESFERWIAEMEAAQAARETNGRRNKADGGKARLDAGHVAILHRERDARKALCKKKPEAWKEDVGGLSGALRERVASIVWWDYFGGRPCKRPWRHLNHWIKRDPDSVSTEELAMGLYLAGYTPWQARDRVRKNEEQAE